MSIGSKNFEIGIGLVPNATTKNTTAGDLEVLTTNRLMFFGASNDAITTDTIATTLTNKNLSDSTTAVVGSIDATKKIVFSASGNTTGITLTINSIATVARTLTFPDATDTLVGKATTDTFTNKSIDAGSNTITGLANANFNGTAAISNANLATMTANTVKANVTGSSATPTDVSATSSSTASSFVIRDTNKNIFANNHINAVTTTATAAATTTLTAASTYAQQFTGTTSQVVILPDATTLTVGTAYEIMNRSTGTVTLESGGTNTVVQIMAAGTQTVATLISNGTATGVWDSSYSSTASFINPMTTLGDTVAESTGTTAVRVPGNTTTAPQVYTQTGNGTNSALPSWNSPAVFYLTPNVQSLLSGTSATYGVSYYFYTTSANATVGATYTNNSQTFTVARTIASSTLLLCTSTGAPTSTGTLTKATGTGDATITFTAIRAPLYLEVEAMGGGGGGGGSGTGATGGTGGTGGTTTFGTSLITATGGQGGAYSGNAIPLGGTGTYAAPAIGFTIQGGQGGSGPGNVTTFECGGQGGNGALGGGGGSGVSTIGGGPGAVNSGGGGAGAGSAGTLVNCGGGGSAGGYVYATVYGPSSTYTYTVGAGGTFGAPGTNGTNGGTGGSGIIIVTEKFQ